MDYRLNPNRHRALGHRLLRDQFGFELGTALAQAWHGGTVRVTAHLTGFDKYGPFEHSDGNCFRGPDEASVHQRVGLTVTPVGPASHIDQAESDWISGRDASRIPAWLRRAVEAGSHAAHEMG